MNISHQLRRYMEASVTQANMSEIAIKPHIHTTSSDGHATHAKLSRAALRAWHLFVGYDLPASTHGFTFSAQGKSERAIQEDVIKAKGGVTLQARLPQPAEARLIHNGRVVKEYTHTEAVAYSISQSGAYHVETYRMNKGERRDWIFSNPSYLK
jgi:hypothetical protein